MLKSETQSTRVHPQKANEYTVNYALPANTRNEKHFSLREMVHLAAGTLLVTGVGFSLAGYQNILNADYSILAAFIATFVASFFVHEMAHKIVAQGKGFWAEFRLTAIGAVLTLLSVFSPILKIISPGTVIVSGSGNTESMGRIAIAGPAMNIIFSITLWAGALVPRPPSSLAFVLSVGAFLNSWIAVLNLVPFGVFDGFKVFRWSKRIWALAFATSLGLTVTSYLVLYA